MHLSLILIGIGLAMLIRLCWFRTHSSWAERWQSTLVAFLFPPLLLVMTSITVTIDHHKTELEPLLDWLGRCIGLGFFTFACLSLCFLVGKQWYLLRQILSCSVITIAGRKGRLLETPALFAAQVGIWNPQLVVSQGLLQSLEPEQLEAVLCHEEAHCYYRDSYWFFGLAWIRQITFWLPKTEVLWKELLLLRELRADHWAAKQADSLVLAESLLLVAQSSLAFHQHHCAVFQDETSVRLEERVEFLMTHAEAGQQPFNPWICLPAIVLPILTIPLHL